MSGLEQNAKPILLPISRGERKLPDLAQGEQHTISRWALKTALVLHSASYSPPVIPETVYKNFNPPSKRIPELVSVFAMQTPDLSDDLRAVSALQSDRFILASPSGLSQKFPRWKISLRIGILQILVVYRADPSWTPLGWRGVHKPLWPTISRLSYPALLRTDQVKPRLESASVLFHLSLALAAGLTQEDIEMMPRPPLEHELEQFFGPFSKDN